jgi:Flp pilus assembly protein TadB
MNPPSAAEFMAADQCDLELAGEPFFEKGWGWGFSRRLPARLADAFTAASEAVTSEGVNDRLYDTYVRKVGRSSCAAADRTRGARHIQLASVLGLWMVLGLATGGSVLYLAVVFVGVGARRAAAWVRRSRRRARRRVAAAAAGEARRRQRQRLAEVAVG